MRIAAPQEDALPQRHVPQREREVALIARANARASDGAVVVHARHAPVAERAVLAPQRPRRVAGAAVPSAVAQRVERRRLRQRARGGRRFFPVTARVRRTRRQLRGRATDPAHVPRPLIARLGVVGGGQEPRPELVHAHEQILGGDKRDAAKRADAGVRGPFLARHVDKQKLDAAEQHERVHSGGAEQREHAPARGRRRLLGVLK